MKGSQKETHTQLFTATQTASADFQTLYTTLPDMKNTTGSFATEWQHWNKDHNSSLSLNTPIPQLRYTYRNRWGGGGGGLYVYNH